ncbi:MAG: hypothetical protein ABSB25_02485 [Sedimentisphaerales bacterium]|jgi:hypothetical protein
MNNENDMLPHLQRIEELLNALLKVQLAPILEKEFSDATKAKLYKAIGKDGIVKLSKKLDCSTGWISGVWKNWEQLGLIVKDGKSYRRILCT